MKPLICLSVRRVLRREMNMMLTWRNSELDLQYVVLVKPGTFHGKNWANWLACKKHRFLGLNMTGKIDLWE